MTLTYELYLKAFRPALHLTGESFETYKVLSHIYTHAYRYILRDDAAPTGSFEAARSTNFTRKLKNGLPSPKKSTFCLCHGQK